MSQGPETATSRMDSAPQVAIEKQGGEARILLSGTWTAQQAEQVETAGDRVLGESAGAARVLLDMTGVERLDTLGAWVVDRARHGVETAGGSVRYVGLTETQKILLREVAFHDVASARTPAASPVVGMLADVGEGVVDAGRDVVGGVSFLGALVSAIGRVIVHPARFRFTSMVYHLEQVGLRSVPIIALISFLVGCIVAQQGIFQLQKFGATPFVVDLIGILTLRELGVLLTSIMIAGRSGSAFTAEIGSMKMREEIDALRRHRPRRQRGAGAAAHPGAGDRACRCLTVVADFAALCRRRAGVSWFYVGLPPGRLHRCGCANAVYRARHLPRGRHHQGAVHGAHHRHHRRDREGFRVQGSRRIARRAHVTSSVVKAIFMVIVVDGLFAMFFAAIKY